MEVPVTPPTTTDSTFDLEASPIPGQIGSATLNLQGELMQTTNVSQRDAAILFQMLVEAGGLPEMQKGDFYRMTVNFSSSRYVVALDDTRIYIVQARN